MYDLNFGIMIRDLEDIISISAEFTSNGPFVEKVFQLPF